MPFAAETEKKCFIRPNRSVILVGSDLFAHSNPILNTSRRLNCRNLGSSKTKKPKNQMNTTKSLIAGAAVAGLMAGSLPVRAYAASAPTQAGVSLQTLAEGEKGTHSCKGQNACKGQGGCKTSDAGCKGKNSCKGKGGCATDGSKPK
jgi:hypothetical protein